MKPIRLFSYTNALFSSNKLTLINTSTTRLFSSSRSWRKTVEEAELKLQVLAIKGSKSIFLYNLKRKLAVLPEAFHLEQMYVTRVEDVFSNLHNSNQDMLKDTRSIYHLQTACLVLAAYRILTMQLRVSNDDAVGLIQSCMGDSDTFMERTIQKGISAIGRIIHRNKPYDALTTAAQNMSRVDMGSAFAVVHEEQASQSPPTSLLPGQTPAAENVGRQHITRVTRCFYVDFFRRHGAPQLVGPLLCRADAGAMLAAAGLRAHSWRAGEAGTAGFDLQATLADGAGECRFVVWEAPAASSGPARPPPAAEPPTEDGLTEGQRATPDPAEGGLTRRKAA